MRNITLTEREAEILKQLLTKAAEKAISPYYEEELTRLYEKIDGE